jgi:hypothetical protein
LFLIFYTFLLFFLAACLFAFFLSLSIIDGTLSKNLLRDVEEALIETAKEADRQKNFVERQSDNLKHRLHTQEKESRLQHRHRLHENSDLLFECNELRAENRDLQRKLGIAQHDLDEVKRNLHSATTGIASSMSTQPNKIVGADSMSPPKSRAIASGTAASSVLPIGGAKTKTGEAAPWIVHNSMPLTTPPLNTSGTGTTNNNIAGNRHPSDGDASLHSLHGIGLTTNQPHQQQQPLISLSQSMPNLQTQQQQQLLSGVIGPSLDSGPFPNVSLQQSLSHSYLPGAVTNQQMSFQPPVITVATKAGGKKQPQMGMPASPSPAAATSKAGKLRTVEANITEKLSNEITNLASQLDDSIRERDLQRLELSRLRKQLMMFSNNNSNIGTNLLSGGIATSPMNTTSTNHIPITGMTNASIAALQRASSIHSQYSENGLLQLPSLGSYTANSGVLSADQQLQYQQQGQQQQGFFPSGLPSIHQPSISSGGSLHGSGLRSSLVMTDEDMKKGIKLEPGASVKSFGRVGSSSSAISSGTPKSKSKVRSVFFQSLSFFFYSFCLSPFHRCQHQKVSLLLVVPLVLKLLQILLNNYNSNHRIQQVEEEVEVV